MIPDIGIFTHRFSEYLPRCIRSVSENTRSSYNLIVVCEPGNCHQNMNKVLQRSRARFVCFLDEDVEILQPDWISLLAYSAESRPDVAIVGGTETKFKHEAKEWKESRLSGDNSHLFKNVEERKFVAAFCMLLDREKIPGAFFDECIPFVKGMSDWDMCLQAEALGFKTVRDHRVLVYHELRTTFPDKWYVDNNMPTEAECFDAYPIQKEYMKKKWGPAYG